MPTQVVADRPPPLLYAAHHAHTPHTPHTPHHAGLLYAPAPQSQLYMDILKNRDGQQHQEPKKEAPQVAYLFFFILTSLTQTTDQWNPTWSKIATSNWVQLPLFRIRNKCNCSLKLNSQTIRSGAQIKKKCKWPCIRRRFACTEAQKIYILT